MLYYIHINLKIFSLVYKYINFIIQNYFVINFNFANISVYNASAQSMSRKKFGTINNIFKY